MDNLCQGNGFGLGKNPLRCMKEFQQAGPCLSNGNPIVRTDTSEQTQLYNFHTKSHCIIEQYMLSGRLGSTHFNGNRYKTQSPPIGT